MPDDTYGPFQNMVDKGREAYKSANDFMNKIMPSKLASPAKDEADPGMVKDANKSFIHPTQTAAQKKVSPAVTPGKTVTKTGPRKRM